MIQTPSDSDFMPYDGFHNCPPVPHDHLMVSPPIGIGPRGEKGEQGEQGPKGDTGEFNTPIVSVDNKTGTPYVVVTSTGEGSEKVFNLAFHNLKGSKGDTFTFNDLTQDEINEIRSGVASTYYRKDEDSYTTIGTNTTTIAIPFADYVPNDMLLVDVEGLLLTEGEDYDISGTNIVLDSPITHANTKVNFKRITSLALTADSFDDLVDAVTTAVEENIDGDEVSY